MNQTELAKRVLAKRRVAAPESRRYLPAEEAAQIVDDTIDYVGRHGEAVTYKYLVGHRRRLAESLALIPCADGDRAACLDVGCFGYMAFWAWRHLGYRRVEGIELQPDDPSPTRFRKIRVWDSELEFKTHNFDLVTPHWPPFEPFDTVLFFETLEHINSDPMRVMVHIRDLMSEGSVLAMSVPNAVSYKTLQEFVSGMPPWNYWFYDPDLSHEPRHCFEYTPFVFESVLSASGLEIEELRSICAFQERQNLDDVYALGNAMSIEPKLFGDTLLARAHKSADDEIVRYPDCIYDSERYYKSTFPLIAPIQRASLRRFVEEYDQRPARHELEEAWARAKEVDARADALVAIAATREIEIAGLIREHEAEILALQDEQRRREGDLAELAETLSAAQRAVAEADAARLDAERRREERACEAAAATRAREVEFADLRRGHDAETSGLRSKVSELQEQSRSLSDELGRRDADLRELRARALEYEAEVSELRNEQGRRAVEFTELAEACSLTKRALAQAEAALDVAERRREEQACEAAAAARAREVEFADLRRGYEIEMSVLKARASEEEKQARSLSYELGRCDADLCDLRGQASRHEAEILALQDEQRRREGDLAELAETLSAAQRAVAEADAARLDAEQRREEQAVELAAALNTCEQYLTKLEQLRCERDAEWSESESKAEEREAQLHSLNDELGRRDAHLCELRALTSKYESEIHNLQNEQRQRVTELAEVAEALADTRREVALSEAGRLSAEQRQEEHALELANALNTCEQYLLRLEQAGADLRRRRRGPLGVGYAAARLELECAKLLCTLGFRKRGTVLWNHAKALMT